MIKGSLVALVTPMHEDGTLDWDRYRALIEFHIAQQTDGLVVVGTTGESPTVDFDEHTKLIQEAVKTSAGRITVIAGTGANSTKEAIELTDSARKAGADACLLVAPYYNKPGQEGLYRHYKAVAEAVAIPQILYNVPGRTASDIANDTALKLAQIPNIVGIKDATGNLQRGTDLILRAPKDFAIYSGDDASGLALMLLGAHGVISVTSNVAPKLMHDMCVAAFAGKVQEARAINASLFALHDKLFVEANPIPVKWCVEQMGLIGPGIRLPLTPLAPGNHETLRAAMRQAGTLD
jgi:4-hydroxy-tetrahydrodipicolinate synthase